MSQRFPKVLYNIIRNVSSKPTTNGEIKPKIYNRNPRNLEKLRLQKKPKGHTTDDIFIEYWHKLELTSKNFLTAQLIHNSGKVVVEASTKEWCLQKNLCTTKDKMAHIVLAKVFAERCLESGISNCAFRYDFSNKETNVFAFVKALEEEGFSIQEPTTYDAHDMWRIPLEKKPWTVLEDQS